MSGNVSNVTIARPAASVVQTNMDRRAGQVVNLDAALVASDYGLFVQRFIALDWDLRRRCCELFLILSSDKTPTLNPTERIPEVLGNPSLLLQPVKAEGRELSIIDHVLYEVRRGVSVDEMVLAAAAPNTPLPHKEATLVAQYAMLRFEDIIFGPQQWKDVHFVTPVNRSLAREFPEPSEALYTYLNSRRQPGEKLVGHTSVVTYIPECVNKHGLDNINIGEITIRNLTCSYCAVSGEPGEGLIFGLYGEQQDRDVTQPSCYFVMEQPARREDLRQDPSDLEKRITQTGDEIPGLRNAMAAAFCHTRWKAHRWLDSKKASGLIQGGDYNSAWKVSKLFRDGDYIYCRSTAPGKPFLALGILDEQALSVRDPSKLNIKLCTLTAVASRTFPVTVLAPPASSNS